MSNHLARSWLIVPVNRPQDVARAARSGADAVVLDMAEFIADKDQAAARAAACNAIESIRAAGPAVYVQTAHASHQDDLRAAVCAALNGVVISRAESAAQVRDIEQCLDALAPSPSELPLVLALETARGNQDAYSIVIASKRVQAITLGRADLAMDLRPEPSGELHMMPYLMQRLVMLAGAVGVTPLGAWWRAPDRGLLSTAENTLKAAQRGRAMGFKGSFCLRADQVSALNTAYA